MIRTSCGRSRPRNRRKGQGNKRIQKTPEPYLTGEVTTCWCSNYSATDAAKQLGICIRSTSLGPWARSQRWRPAWTASILDCVFYLFMPAKWTSSGLGGLQAIHAARKSRRWEKAKLELTKGCLCNGKIFLNALRSIGKEKAINEAISQAIKQSIQKN